MTQRVRGAFGSFLALSFAAAVALAASASTLAAQGSTGKVEGTVTDQAGVPIANAQVFIVGTTFGGLSNDKGYYFINNVPAGVQSVRAQFIGYQPSEVTNVRVLAGQTMTVDIKMQASAVQVTGVTVTAAVNPIVPRDQVTSLTHITDSSFAKLPVENSRALLSVQPGVVESNNGKGLSIRGGRPGEAAEYVDGVLVRNNQRGETDLNVGVNALEEASITTGAIGAEFGQAQSGVISFVTKAGGQHYQGSFSYQSDDLGLWQNVGFNRLEGSFSGPISGNLTFAVSAALNGQKSADAPLNSDKDNPIYVRDGVEQVVRQPATVGDDPTDTVLVSIPRFVQYNGSCDANANFGVACQGIRVPFSANGGLQAHTKLQYTYGSGSRVFFTAMVSDSQQRNQPISNLYNPNNMSGTSFTSYLGILGWTQNLSKSADRAMSLDVHASYQRDNAISGVLTRQSELDSRNPFGGFLISPLDYLFNFNSTHDVTINGVTTKGVQYLSATQIRCLLVGSAHCSDNVPFLDDNDLQSAQPYRMNPYGVEQSARLPLWTNGQDGSLFLGRESRWYGRADFDWQADRFNRVKLGAEGERVDTWRYSAGITSPFGMSAYHEKPIVYGGYVNDRLDLGDVVIEAGLRYDYYSTRARYPFTPGRISTDTGFNANNPTADFITAPSHSAWSPDIRVSFPVTEHSNFRLSYAHQVQPPDFDIMFRGMNTDLSLTNQNQSFGRDLAFTKTIIFEFGVRHAFSQDMVLDVSAYNKDKTADIAGRLFQLPDPQKNGGTSDFRVFTNADFGNVRGVDFKLDRRFSNLFTGALTYTFQVARNTGSDPFSYFNTTARVISSLTNETAPPPQAILATNDNRTHNIAGTAALNFPADWQQGTTLGNVLRNVGVFATFRFASGLPYTRVQQAGEGVRPGGFGLEATNIEPINSSTLPWIKNVDLRVTKGVRVGNLDWTLFAEGKNIFNWKNIVSIFTETGDVTNSVFLTKFLSEQDQLLQQEAAASGYATTTNTGEPAVDLRGGAAACGGWVGRNTPGSAASGPVDCVMLQDAEKRFGNGDGVYTQSEYERAFTAWYNLANAPSSFYGIGRRLRLGAELTF